MKRKLIVITDGKGEIVGTQVHEDPTLFRGGIFARLVAGGGQKRHVIEIEVPTRLASREDIDRFHTHVKKQLH